MQTSKVDYLWYQPEHRDRVLDLIHIPDAAEREARGIFGLVFAPGQPAALGFKNPHGQTWKLVFGNFLGYPIDPNQCARACELTEIEDGLIGGMLRPEIRESKEFQKRAQTRFRAEQQRKQQRGGQTAEQRARLEMAATDELLLAVATRMNVRRPEKLTRGRLLALYEMVAMTDEFDVPPIGDWIAGKVPPAPVEITLENCPDWEKYMLGAYASVKAPPLQIVKPYSIERTA